VGAEDEVWGEQGEEWELNWGWAMTTGLELDGWMMKDATPPLMTRRDVMIMDWSWRMMDGAGYTPWVLACCWAALGFEV